MVIFQFFKMTPAAILDFQNVEISEAGRLNTAKMRQRAKFRVDRSKCFSIFQDGSRRHHGFSKGLLACTYADRISLEIGELLGEKV